MPLGSFSTQIGHPAPSPVPAPSPLTPGTTHCPDDNAEYVDDNSCIVLPTLTPIFEYYYQFLLEPL